MKRSIAILPFIGIFVIFLFLNQVSAQMVDIPSHQEFESMYSGIHQGNGGAETVIAFKGVLSVSNSPWVRLQFNTANLGEASFIKIRSTKDGKWQKLDQTNMLQWEYSSAYFNGNSLEIELHVAPFDKDIFFKIDQQIVGDWLRHESEIESQCGPTDDRIHSNQPATGRLMNIGCTAWIIPNGHFVTAGHCVDGSGVNVVEFQVPPSLPGGTVQHPGPEDQYAVISSSIIGTNGGIGNDWGSFEVFPNSVTGLMPKDAQGAYWPLNQDLGPDSIRITGYGVDDGVDNQVQQTHVGPNAGSSGTTMRYVTDTEGGNSGSPVIDAATGYAVGVHTHGGCSTTGTGNNNGTSLFHQAFWDAVEHGLGGCGIEAASNPNPAHSATNVSVNLTELTWTNGAGAISNELYFGSDPASLPLVQSGTLATSWTITSGPLSYGTVYYWRIIEIGDTCSTPGSVWSFSTENDPNLVFLFEEYFPDLSQWTINGPLGLTNWSIVSTNTAGGTPPELQFHYSPTFTGFSYIMSDVIPNAGIDYTIQFNHFVDWYANPMTVGCAYTTDDGTSWTSIWEIIPTGNVGPEEIVLTGIPGHNNFRLGFYFSGYSFNIDDWYIDNVFLTYIVPVELTSFSANVTENEVKLLWSTASETNNRGFEIERKSSGEFEKIGFMAGYGTTTEFKSYTFSDKDLAPGNYTYRMKQIDFDGEYDYTEEIEVLVSAPKDFALRQNYPNPFNPGTKIEFSLKTDSKVTLVVFDILGQEVANLISSHLMAGVHEINFDASALNSGVYFYRIDATGIDGSNFTSVKKMILTK
jgi:V8-like Glu-specific endopeptidase